MSNSQQKVLNYEGLKYFYDGLTEQFAPAEIKDTVNSNTTKLDYTNIAYGTCATAADVAEKIVTIDGNSKWVLDKGSIITVKFTNTNSAASPTINVNSTGAYPIYYNASEYTSASSYGGYANRHITYQFNGTHWVFISWSYDSNSDTKVTQAAAITTAGEYPVILGYSTATSSVTNTVKKTSTLTYNPSTKILTAPTFKGDLDGTAAKATADASGNNIVNTYATKNALDTKVDKSDYETFKTNVNTLLDSDDETLDQMSEIVAYTKSNKSLIDSITTSKQDKITGAAMTITSSDLTASRVLISDNNGKVAASSSITTTELGYLDGATSNLQTQITAAKNTADEKLAPTDITVTVDGTGNAITEASYDGEGTITLTKGATFNNYSLPTASSTLGGVKTTSTVTSTSGYTPVPIIGGVPYYKNTTYSAAKYNTLGLVKPAYTSTGAATLTTTAASNTTTPTIAAKTTTSDRYYAVEADKNGILFVNVPWSDTNTHVVSSVAGKTGAVTLSKSDVGLENVENKSSATIRGELTKENVTTALGYTPPTTDTNTHYTTKIYAGASGTTTNAATSNPYLKVVDDNTYRNQIQFKGSGATTVSSDANGVITISSTDNNTTYDLMGAATSSAAGTSGLVPAPAAGKQLSFLRGDGTWVVPTNTDTKVTQTATEPTSAAVWYLLSATSTATGATTAVKNSDFRVQVLQGTADKEGYIALTLGNDTASGTAGNKRGQISIYSSNTGYHTIKGADCTTYFTHTLPAKSGTVLNSGTTSFTPALTSGTKIGTIKINDVSTDIYCSTNSDTKVTQTIYDTAGDGYLLYSILGTTNTADVKKNTGIRIRNNVGTTSAVGESAIILGNSTASGAAGNKQGRLYIYSPGSEYHIIETEEILAGAKDSYTHTLPAATGILLNSGNYTTYTVKKDGTGASGTWEISISGTAAKATTWATSRTLTIGAKAQSVNGSADVSWSLYDILKAGSIGNDTSWEITEPGVYHVSGSAFTGSGNPEAANGGLAPYRYGQLIVSKGGPTGGLAEFYISHADSKPDATQYGIKFRTGWNGTYQTTWRTLVDNVNISNFAISTNGGTLTGGNLIIDRGTEEPKYAAYRTVNSTVYRSLYGIDSNGCARMGSYDSDWGVLNAIILGPNNTTLNKPLTVGSGGTGATTASAALTNLGGVGYTVISDISSLL